MPRKTISFELDFMIKDIFPRFTVKQFDDVSFNIKPKNQGIDYNTTGMTGKIFVGVDNDMFMQTTGITVSSNNINVLLDKNMLQNRGRAYAEIELTDSHGTITSSSFIFNIDEKIGEGAKIPGGYEGFVAKYERLISQFKSQVNSTIDNCNTNINSTINNCNKAVDNKLNDVDNFVDNKILDIEKRFNTLTSSRQQESEVIDARDGEVSLKARLDRDLYKDGISLSDRIEAIEGLKDSQNMKYETDKGYLVCKETKNGVIDDLKLEGRTLVNLTPKYVKGSNLWASNTLNSDDYGFVTANADSTWLKLPSLRLSSTNNLKPSTKYTLVIEIKSNTLVGTGSRGMNFSSGISGDYAFKNKIDIPIGSVGTFVYTVNTVDSFENVGYLFRSQLYDTCTEGSIIYRWYLLEGDHTQNPPSYFEGLMSVGEDVDEIEVLSQNKNFCTVDNLIQGGYQIGTTPVTHTNATNRVSLKVDNTIKGNSLYINSPYNIAIIELDKDNKLVYDAKWLGVGKKEYTAKMQDCARLGVSFKKNDETNITVAELLNSKTTIASIQNKKQILFYNSNGELEPVTELHEWDSIEKHSDGKYYYHQRSAEVVLNGSENWSVGGSGTETNFLFFTKPPKSPKSSSMGICDKFKFKLNNNDRINESVYVDTDINVRILKSKLSSQDVTGFKQWLQENNVTVVYQLAEEEVYELAPLHLDSYANETLILCNSGAISPKMEFSITSHINQLVKAYGERVNLLEEKVYKYMVAQNRLQLASTYSADSVTFKVDYALCNEGEEEYNNDLYDLILNNILVGKDNYDYDKMFNIILDYASWNQISWEQFDILVGLMDMQHNPPIEELPTEDIIEEDIIEEETPVE